MEGISPEERRRIYEEEKAKRERGEWMPSNRGQWFPDTERTAAGLKSYVNAAIIVLVLYWVLWIPGFVANIVYYMDAKRTEAVAGQSLPGTGCLTVMLVLNVITLGLLILAGIVILLIIVVAAAATTG